MFTKKIKNSKSIILRSVMYALFFSSLVLIIPACKKDSNDSKAHLSIRMTDAPANFEAVLVDIQGVEVMGSDGNAVVLNTNKGIYNLLDFSNGLDTLIASADVNAGTISQIRLLLGPNNSVIVNGDSFPLSTPSAMQSGLKLQIHQTFEANVSYSILLDFDANQSIVTTGSGTYQLKPVIRTINAAINGSIKGNTTPVGFIALVTATSGSETYTTVTNDNGYFMVTGLPAGTYVLTITPALPLLPVTITGNVVVAGVSTNVGLIAF
jgi:hypothetical protein